MTVQSRMGILAAACLAVTIANSGVFAQDKGGTIGVSMPNIKGPWFTPVLYGISDEAKKLGYSVNIQDAGAMPMSTSKLLSFRT